MEFLSLLKNGIDKMKKKLVIIGEEGVIKKLSGFLTCALDLEFTYRIEGLKGEETTKWTDVPNGK